MDSQQTKIQRDSEHEPSESDGENEGEGGDYEPDSDFLVWISLDRNLYSYKIICGSF